MLVYLLRVKTTQCFSKEKYLQKNTEDLKLSKNVIISALVIVIAILIGVIIMTNSSWFSQEWLIGLCMILGSIVGSGILIYLKIRK